MNTTSDLKQQNAREILRTIQYNNAISKNEVAEILGISTVTAHTIIKELWTLGLCRPTGEMRYRGGRNAMSYEINGAYGLIISVLLVRDRVTTMVYDFSLRLQYKDVQPVDIQDVWSCIRFTGEQIEKAILAFPDKNILGIGISMPGRSDREGTILSIPDFPQWKHIPLGNIYREQFRLPVVIDNDNNALLLSTRWNGLSTSHKSLAYLYVHGGVGMGFFSNGKLFHGNNGFACEIGHTTIQYDGPLCRCGNRGCIQTFLSHENLLEKLNAVRSAQNQALFSDMSKALSYLKSNKDDKLYQVFSDALYFFALLITHVINTFDPQTIYIRCDWLSAFPELFGHLNVLVQENCPWMRQDRIGIHLDDNEHILLSSPACLFLETYFQKGLPL